ncbi:hypothetical protein FisN_12Hh349 [Fistulifera solaris]|uniref:Uncharacterized protein n=1 Tax=Fistulifera solaris TaxID=1519565 RepID=A0A1Z5KCF5_FISSO|nr:hypothetical protein FisN_12Hh349 [Fistulifera solaris]|eukprot:GAX23771.1 hypothetical protein FisN_12Hh349 [Fistulifera solaris]
MQDAETNKLPATPSGESETPRNNDSLLAGVTRSAASTLRQLGVSSAALGGYIRKRAFLSLGSLAAKHGPEESVVSVERTSTSTDKKVKMSSRISANIKLTLEGFASFGIYDLLILQDWFFPRQQTPEQCKSDVPLQRRNSFRDFEGIEGIRQTINSSPIVAHFIAGALAGVAQSLVMDVWEINAYWWNHMRSQSFPDTLRKGVNFHLLYRRFFHSAASHSTLFGSYEVFRRTFLEGAVGFLSSHPTAPWIYVLTEYGLVTKQSNGVYDMFVVSLSATFLAGGFAGQAHAVFIHYASHWKMRNHSRSSNSTLGRMPKRPSLRMIARGFLPSALAFTVFEHGADIILRCIDVDQYLV